MSKFHELINADQPVLVDFFADWCQPCKMMTPILKEVAASMGEKAIILKVNIDKNPAAASHFSVQAVPTLVLFKKGKIEWRQSGVVPAGELINILTRYM